jgi:hypothetical protein
MEDQAIRDLIASFIGTLKTKNRALMQSQLLPGFSATLVRSGSILLLDEKAFIDRLPWEAEGQRRACHIQSSPLFPPRIWSAENF